MSSASEAAGAIDGLRQQASELAGKVNSSKGQAETMAGALEGIGAEDKSRQVGEVANKLEAAESSRAGFEGTLAKAHFVMLSVIHGTMGPAAEPSGTARSHPYIPTPGEPAAEKFDFVEEPGADPRPDQLRYIADEPATLPEELDPFDDSELASKPVRAVRVASRGLDDLQGGAKQTTTDIYNLQHFFDPPADQAYTETQPKDSSPEYTFTAPPGTHFDPIQAAAQFTAMSVAVAKVAVGRMRKRNR